VTHNERDASTPLAVGGLMKRVAIMLACMSTFVLGWTPAGANGPTLPVNGGVVFSRYAPRVDDNFTYITNLDGTVRKLFRDFPSGSPHWSPDGTRVAVSSGLGISDCSSTCSGYTVIIDPADGSWHALAPVGMPRIGTFCSRWSPDGRTFACEGGNDNDASVNGIYTIRSSDGGGLRRITDADGMSDAPIAWSPDGSKIVFGRSDFGECTERSAIYVVNVDGTNEHRITPWGFCDNHGDWSDDGRWILFQGPNGSVFVVHPYGTDLTRIPLPTPGGRAYAGDISWSPDGTRLVMLAFAPTGPSGEYREGIATANVDGTGLRFVTVSPTFDHEADWGPRPS
jgi:Tol biopolymer transport system component